jgi:hypothetical protein
MQAHPVEDQLAGHPTRRSSSQDPFFIFVAVPVLLACAHCNCKVPAVVDTNTMPNR